MAGLAPMRVTGPPPKPPMYGLTTTPGTIIPQPDPHWTAGVVVDSYPTDLPSAHNPCAAGTARVKAVGTDPPAPEFSSFTVYIPVTCSGLGVGNEAGAELLRNRAREAFAARETFGVEQEFAHAYVDPGWPGTADDRPHLTGVQPADYLNAGAATGPREALGLLENAIGLTAQEGVIHLDPATFDAMASYPLFVDNAGVMRTRRGNLVIIGNGYIGARPDPGPDLTADQNWAFATGPVAISRDEVVVTTLAESFDHETNEITFRVERNYVAYWDTALLKGVLVDRSTTP